MTDQELNSLLDDILRQVVCDCGNYRHHGVSWMPEGSGEGLSIARGLLRKALAGGPRSSDYDIRRCRKDTDHAEVPGTGFCRCTHVMYDAQKTEWIEYDSAGYPHKKRED
jgi:hypothetical protein